LWSPRRFEESQELLAAVAAVEFTDHGAVADVERGEQAGDPGPAVVVGAALGHAGHHRQRRLGLVQGLVIWGNEDQVPRCRRSSCRVRVRDRKSKRAHRREVAAGSAL
jgi:hypothetical protein